jgi:hypothetical protein
MAWEQTMTAILPFLVLFVAVCFNYGSMRTKFFHTRKNILFYFSLYYIYIS